MIPPHLPPPVCDIQQHRQRQRLGIILLSSFLGLVAGLSGASIIIGWIWPAVGEGERWAVSYYRSSSSRIELEQRVFDEMKDKIVQVYSAQSSLGDVKYFDAKDKIGEAVVISSDGWMVMYYPHTEEQFKNWFVRTADGTVFKLDKALKDTSTQLLYLKSPSTLKTNFGKPVEFNQEVEVDKNIFAYQQGVWQGGFVNNKVREPLVADHLDTAGVAYYALNSSFPVGSVVIDPQGKMLGIVIQNSFLLPSTAVTRVLPTILSTQKVTYPSLGVRGWFGTEKAVVDSRSTANNFVVTDVVYKNHLLKRGDNILEINDKIVDPEILWYTVSINKEVKLKISRAGKIIEVVVKVVEI